MRQDYSVCLASYQPIILEAMNKVFERDPAATFAGYADSPEEVSMLLQDKKPDAFIFDCPGEKSMLACIRAARKSNPSTRVIILTGSANIDRAVRALEAGANGYLTTRATAAEIMEGVRRVAGGETLVCASLAMNVMCRIRELAQERLSQAERRLTSREETVSKLLARGRTNREIAEHIGLSERTVKHYVSSLIQKFAVRNRTQLVLAMSNKPPRDVSIN